MSTSVSSPRRPAYLAILRFVHDRNPFYLLSALCMFVGFRFILGALNSAPGDWKTLLELIITLNVYEVVMIALALLLIVRYGLRRDGWILLGIEALFLLDLTNLNAELYTAMPLLGSAVNAICFLLAMGKILFILRSLGLRLSPGTTFYIAAQLALMFGLPGLFRLMRSPTATISPMQIYSIWWLISAVVASGAFLIKRNPTHDRSPMAALPFRLYIVLPLISLLVHLASENRVYWVHFHVANLAPLMLAFAVVVSQTQSRWNPLALKGALGLIALAVVLSIVPPIYQHDLSGRLLGVAIAPLRLILIGSSLLSMWLAVRHHSWVAAQSSAGTLALAGMGTNAMDIESQALHLLRWMLNSLLRLIPESPAQWGLVAIIGAFLLLGVGALVSLKAAPPPAEVDPVT